MYLPIDDSELTNIVWWTNPPRDRYRGRAKAEWLFEQLETLPALKGVCVPEKDRELFEFALDLQATGKTGLYVGFLLVLAFRGDPTACLLVAGALAQRMADGHSQNPRNLKRRIEGWLKLPRAEEFSAVIQLPASFFRRPSDEDKKKRDARSRGLRRSVEINERKVTVVAATIGKWKSDSSSSEQYDRLNEPLELKGDITHATTSKLLAALRYEYPWAEDLLRDIEHALTLSAAAGRPWLALPPILLLGPAGVGKTRFARRLAELSDVPLHVINAGGSSDNRDFAGTARGWGTAKPARIVEIFRETECANPIVLIDEIDKAGGSGRNGKMASTLLTMLEPETRGRFYDEALGTNVDLSFVNWILTANDIAELGKPLLSRLRLVHMPPPPPTAADRVIDTILAELGRRQGLPAEDAPGLEPEVREALVSAVRRGMSPRRLNAVLEEILAIEIRKRLAS